MIQSTTQPIVRLHTNALTSVKPVGGMILNEVINHLEGLKAQIHEWLEIMSDDPHFAPPAWVMESMWTRLNLIISVLDPSEEL